MADWTLGVAQDDERKAVRQLWQYCFDDSEAFVEWYFTHYYRSENTLVVRLAGEVKAATEVIPYTIKLDGQRIAAGYVVGVSTAPEVRRQGLGRQMLAGALALMRERGQNLSLLMPFEGSFYYEYGWQFCYFQLRYAMPLEHLRGLNKPYGQLRLAGERDLAQLNAVYERFMDGRNGWVVRDDTNWRNLLADCALDGGWIYLLIAEGQPEGYVNYYFDGAKVIVKEMAYSNRRAKAGLLDFLYGHRSHKKTVAWQAPVGDDTVYRLMRAKDCVTWYPFMMARIVDVGRLLTSLFYPADHEPVVLRIKDELAPWNDGCFAFAVEAGQGRIAPSKAEADITLDIGALTQLVMGAVTLAELLAQERVTLRQDELLHSWDKLWVKQENFINEYY